MVTAFSSKILVRYSRMSSLFISGMKGFSFRLAGACSERYKTDGVAESESSSGTFL